ncbi:phage protein Gp36 family protein [Flavobacterium sp. TN-1]
MSFILEEDYSALIRSEIKDILLENYSPQKLSIAQDMAISQIKNYLSGKYDVSTIFNAQGKERNPHLVMVVIDCTLYHLYTSAGARKISEIRSQRYQDAIDWLKEVAKGEITPDLPKMTDSNNQVMTGFKISSKNKPSNHRW